MAKDFLFDDDNDLAIQQGDFRVGESTNQEIETLMNAAKGHYYEFPKVGIDIRNWINGSIEPQKLQQQIKLGLIQDGFSVRSVVVSEDFKISIDAERKTKS